MIETPHARRRAAPRAGVLALQRDARADRARCSPASTCWSIDLQDVGTRIYTYIYTMANCLRAARRHGIRVVVCDRPNPIGGDDGRGRRCSSPAFESFVGQFPIPMRHGMTIGELARLFNDALRHRRRSSTSCRWRAGRARMYFDETGLPWVLPSPNMPTLDTAIVYPGTVLFEGTHAVGRARHDAAVRARRRAVDRRRAVRRRDERASACRASYFRPVVLRADVPQAREGSRAAAARFTSPIARRSRRCEPASRCIDEFRRAAPDRFAWREPPYEYEHDKLPIDILVGSDRLRRQIDAGERRRRDRRRAGRGDEDAFRRLRQPYPAVLIDRERRRSAARLRDARRCDSPAASSGTR